MPKMRVSMRKIREVLRLTHELGLSVREVSKATGVGKTAVGAFVARAKMIGITWPVPPEISDAELERRFGRRVVQRAMFEGMARAYVPEASGGFEGRIAYELRRNGATDRWTIEISGARASAIAGDGREADLVLRMPVADFARLAAGTIAPLIPFLEGRASVEGNVDVAMRLGEMFGGPSPY